MEYLKEFHLTEHECSIVQKARWKFDEMIAESDGDYYGMANHLAEVEQWAQFALKAYSSLDPYVFLLGIWLHDIGFIIKGDPDHHDSNGERVAREFLLQQQVSDDVIQRVCHCVRSHRRKDVMPESLEAQMIACVDSASHFTDKKLYYMYCHTFGFEALQSKIERDYRDTEYFPEIHRKVLPLYQAWTDMLQKQVNFVF